MVKFLSSKWLSLFCCLINSTFCSIAWNSGETLAAVICAVFASLCAWNFITALQQENSSD